MVYSNRRFVLSLALGYFVLVVFVFFSVLLALRLPCLGKRELILVLFVCLFDLRLFGFVCFLFLLVSGKGYGFVALPGLFSYLFCYFMLLCNADYLIEM